MTVERGNDMHTMGLHRGGGDPSLWLRPEEALALLEDGVLRLMHTPAPTAANAPAAPVAIASVQQAYELLMHPAGPVRADVYAAFRRRDWSLHTGGRRRQGVPH